MKKRLLLAAMLAGAFAATALADNAAVMRDVSFSGFVPTTETLVGTMSPSDSVTNITDISGLIGGKSWAASLKGTPYSRVDVASADGDTKLVVQFKQYESPYTKCVVVEFTKDASGGIYAKAVKAAYIAYNNLNFDFSQSSGYSGSTVATADDVAAYGVKGLSFKAPLDPVFTFDSTTTTDLNEPTGWACGYVPVGENVIISGTGVTGALSSSTAAFASVTVINGATLTLGNGTTATNVSLVGSATLAVASGATATLGNALSTIVEAQDVPAISIPSGATLNVPGGTTFGNVSISVGGTLAATTAGDLTLGYAPPGETATFGLAVNGGTISTASGNICFFYPASGGTVTPLGTVTFTGATFAHDNEHGFNIGVNNPDAIAVTFVFDNTTLNYPKKYYYTISGGSALRFVNGGRLYRAHSQNDKFTLTVSGLASIFLGDGTSSLIGESANAGGSVGSGAMTFNPSTDGHVALVISNAVWETYHADGKGKAVAEIYGDSVHTINQDNWNRVQPFNAFKAINLNAGATLTISNNIGKAAIDFTEKFTGPGSLLFSTPQSSTKTFNFKSTTSTATGTLSADATRPTMLAIASGATWGGTVLWNGHASLEATDGTPFSYTFGGIRADAPFTFRLWEGGTCDTVNLTGEGWTGLAEPVISMQGGYDPAPGDRWVLGTIPAGSSVPPLTSARWILSTEAIDGDADNVRLVLSMASVDFTFNSTTTTDINDPSGWTCGYVPVGESVSITGRNVRVVLDATNCIPVFSSVTVRDGATLEVTETNNLSAIELRTGASLVVDGATAVLAAISTIAPGEGEPLPTFSILNGGTAVAPGGTGFKNIVLRMDGGTLMNDGSGPLYLGTANANESAVFGLVATNSTIQTRGNTALYFMSPASGGAVAPIGDLALTNCVVDTGVGQVYFGHNNPTNLPFTVRFHGTDLAIASMSDISSAITFSGAGTVALDGGSRFYRATPYNPQYGAFTPTFQKRGRLTLTGTNTNSPADFRYPFCGNGNAAIVSKPDEDGFATIEFTDARAWVWRTRPNLNTESNGKAVWKVADTSFAFGMLYWWGIQQVPFHGLKAVEIADGKTLTLERRKLGSPWNYGDTNVGGGSDDASGDHTIRLANVPFTGGGSVIVTNTYNRDFHVLVSSSANTAAGTIAAYDHPANAGKTKVLFNDGANWAGTVVAGDGVALVKNAAASLNDKFSATNAPATVSFGGVRFDGDLTLRLWEDGSADKVNFGSLGFSGPGGIAFAFPTAPSRTAASGSSARSRRPFPSRRPRPAAGGFRRGPSTKTPTNSSPARSRA